MKHPDKKNEMPLRDYSWIIFLPFVALGWMAFKAALENAAALIVWLVYSLFLLFPILLILRYPVLTETGIRRTFAGIGYRFVPWSEVREQSLAGPASRNAQQQGLSGEQECPARQIAPL